jgi:hypothetical protein
MIGYTQGAQTIDNNVVNIVYLSAANNPNMGTLVGNYYAGLVQALLNQDYGSFWVFGVLLIIAGFLLIILGDRKHERNPEAEAPLLLPPPPQESP